MFKHLHFRFGLRRRRKVTNELIRRREEQEEAKQEYEQQPMLLLTREDFEFLDRLKISAISHQFK